MWVEELRLENIKCFENATLRFAKKEGPSPWVTLLSENGGGKTTVLQALALLLAGPQNVQNLMPRPTHWLRNPNKYGTIATRIHQGESDPGQYGAEKISRAFGYSFFVTGNQPLSIRGREYTEPTIVENPAHRLTWLRQNAFLSKGEGWFAVGYGAFRRLTRSSQIIIPSLEAPARFTNFTTLFQEEEPLSAFERWMVYLDYRITKAQDPQAKQQQERGIACINRLLPKGVRFERVTEEGRVSFNVHGNSVPTMALSDGYRSILALAGDLVWRLLLAFPESANPFEEEGVVLIDELDIHLHPIWQRQIAGWLREQFPNLQFIVATHSPLIAAGAGTDALTLKFSLREGKGVVEPVEERIAVKSVDAVLQSEAFQLVSPFSPETQAQMDLYDSLRRKTRLNAEEKRQLQGVLDFFGDESPFEIAPEPGSLEARMREYLQSHLK